MEDEKWMTTWAGRTSDQRPGKLQDIEYNRTGTLAAQASRAWAISDPSGGCGDYGGDTDAACKDSEGGGRETITVMIVASEERRSGGWRSRATPLCGAIHHPSKREATAHSSFRRYMT